MAAQRVFTLQELTQHNSKQDCWLVIHGKVVDVTKFLEDHPGGEQVLLEFAGKDGTKEFEVIGHSKVAKQLVLKYQVGVLQGYKHSDDPDYDGASLDDDIKESTKEVGKEMTGFVIKDDDDVQQQALTGKVFDHVVPLAVVFGLLWFRFSPLLSEMMMK